MHRDLSSNNIMIIAGTKAKVSDFGMATVLGNTGDRQLTALPGTMAYMPPEASPNFQSSTPYSFKLDCFSLGVLNIQICTRRYPHPLPALRLAKSEDEVRGSSRELWERVPETERRRPHIELVNPSNPLLPLAIECLSDDEATRPSADEVCQKLESIKTSGCTSLDEVCDHDSLTSSTYSSVSEHDSLSSTELTHHPDCSTWQSRESGRENQDDEKGENIEESFKELLQDSSDDTKRTDLNLKWREQVPTAGRNLLKGDCVTDDKNLFVICGTVISCFETDRPCYCK